MELQNRLQAAVLNINNEKIPLYEGVNTVGRNKDAVAIIKHMTVSQNHAVIVIINGQHYISDLNSSNGSFFEGSKMTPFKLYQLRNDTKVTLGELSGKYISKGPFSEMNSSAKLSNFGISQSFYGCSTQLLGSTVMQDTDIHDAPTQEISWANIKHTNKGKNMAYTHSPSVSLEHITDLTDHFNDENLPCLENSEAFPNSKFNSQAQTQNSNLDEQTEVLQDNKLPPATIQEDDEDTDCEDNIINVKLENTLTCQKFTTKPENNVKKSPQHLEEFDNDSSDSLEFLKCEKSTTTDKADVEDKTSQHGSDTEDFAIRRSRKSVMVISTQDLNDSSDLDTSVIGKESLSCRKNLSETKLKLSNNCFEDSIPPTQNQSEAELDESDFIPATQEVNTCEKNSRSSEESFKLGLTELMTDSSQDTNKSNKMSRSDNKDQAVTSENNQEHLDIFSAPTQKASTGEKEEEVLNVREITSDDTFLAPTQKTSTKDVLDLKTTTSDDLFLAPTQKVSRRKPKNNTQDDIDMYDAPTQKICIGVENPPPGGGVELDIQNPNGLINSLQGVCETETDIYDAPTQKVSIVEQTGSTLNEETLEMNIYPSNKLDVTNEIIYDCPTQKLFIDPANLEVDSPTSKQDKFTKNETDLCGGEGQESTEIYDVPTQKACMQANEQEFPVEEKTDFGTPPDEVDAGLDSKPEIKSKKGDRKVFSFKKKSCNLNASLSALADKASCGTNNALPENNLTTDTVEADKIHPGNNELVDKLDSIGNENSVIQNDTLSNGKESNLSTKYQKLDDTMRNTFNATNSEVNQSMAMLESKIVKTRKSGKASDIRITVPRSRRSMSISKIEEAPKCEVKDSLESVSKIIMPEQKSLKVTKRSRTSTKQAQELDLKPRKTSKRTSKTSSSTADAASSSISLYTSSRGRHTISHPKPEPKNSSRTKSSSYLINNNNFENVLHTVTNQTALIEEVQADTKATSSKASKRKKPPPKNDADAVPVEKDATPTKIQKLHLSDEVHHSAQRGLRKQRPKVVFTMMENPQLESLIKQLGGSVVDSVESCTVLVTERVKRSQKLLSAIGLGKPICAPKWITDSKKAHEFLDPWNYILVDPEAEAKWNFSLKESLDRSKQQKLLQAQGFVIQTANGADVLKGAIESCGGKCLSKVPATSQEDVYIVSSPDNRAKYSKIIKKHSSVKVIEAEAIFDGVLRQEIRVSKHILT